MTVRQPSSSFSSKSNSSGTIAFIRNGSKKRRHLAFQKARLLQQEMGVAPTLKSVK